MSRTWPKGSPRRSRKRTPGSTPWRLFRQTTSSTSRSWRIEGYTFLAASGTGLEKIKAEKRRDELTAVVAASPDKNRAKRVRASDVPEFSTGMVGRVLVNGKDAGVLLTFQPGRRMDYTPLNDILQKSKAAGLRVVLEGYISCTVSTEFYVYQSGQSGGPDRSCLFGATRSTPLEGPPAGPAMAPRFNFPPGSILCNGLSITPAPQVPEWTFRTSIMHIRGRPLYAQR